MSTTQSVLCQETIRNALTHSTNGVLDADGVADATISTWQQVIAQLAPVIGKGGFDVLFNRSLLLTCTTFSWLSILGDHRDTTALFENLRVRLAGRDTDSAVEASYTLLETFIGLLRKLIGESLTERLLGPVLVPPSKSSELEITP
jgi:hypothetical protein